MLSVCSFIYTATNYEIIQRCRSEMRLMIVPNIVSLVQLTWIYWSRAGLNPNIRQNC